MEKMTESQPSFFQDVHNIFHEGKSVQIVVVASILIAVVIFIIIIIELLYLLTKCISSRRERPLNQTLSSKMNSRQIDTEMDAYDKLQVADMPPVFLYRGMSVVRYN